MSCELLRSGEAGGSVHTDLNRKEWLFFLCPLAVMLIECFTLTGCCVLDLQTYLSLSNHNKDTSVYIVTHGNSVSVISSSCWL